MKDMRAEGPAQQLLCDVTPETYDGAADPAAAATKRTDSDCMS